MSSTSSSSDKAEIMAENEKLQTMLEEEDPIPEEGTPERLRAERKLVRKLDTRVLPTVVLIYIMNYIDRLAVSTARLKGLEQDLGLSDLQYNVILSIVYVSYCSAQLPSNMLLNWIKRPSLYIGANVVAWGLISTLTGITQSYGGILATRFLIGIPECAFYPGTVYLLSRWYTKKELAFRSAILYSGLLISNAFGSLIAAGILSNMNGTLGIEAWRWLFFIEGAITMFIGLNTMWLLPDYPVNTRWMSSQECRLAQARLADDAAEADQDTATDSPLQGLLMAVKDIKVWIFALMDCAQLLGLSAIAFFPTLTATLGFSTTVSLLLVAPPWILATILCCLNAWHADRTGERFFHQSMWWWGVCIGFIISLATENTAARYVSLFLMAAGYVGASMCLVWVSNVFPRPPAKRAAIMGLVNGIGNLGNLMGSFIWKTEWGPAYHQSMIICFVSLVFSTVLSIILRQLIIRDNKKLDADEKAVLGELNHTRVKEAARLEGITLEQAMQRRKGFRYLY
ncbi:major facilitator superfamily domain-containing protein [Rhodocollybia butyracea]|uniref:Major facilitator superfamily domain-containing protein n=1 Tax=Rhodocollybia butyracea TaxID=206335 RepID=A0A9P5Q5R3_9AGAR|nr:major facilitator superfamily domain-containing protein [Rhodocollybia butyracea]